MLAILFLSMASSIEIPIRSTETNGFHSISALSLIKNLSFAPVYFINLNEFYVKATIGGQNVNLFLDLDTDETIVALTECYCTKPDAPLYNPQHSLTSTDVSGSRNGYDSLVNEYKLYTDDVAFESLTAYDQFFLAATWHSTYHEPLSGSLGLGDLKKNKNKQNFVQNLYDTKKIKNPIFSLALMNPLYPDHSSVLTIGEHDFSKYSTGSNTTIESNKVSGAWSTSVSSLKLDSVTYSSREVLALFVPSVSYIILPPIEHKLLMSKIESKFQCENSGFDYCLCNSSSDVYSFPELSFTIDGNSYTISAQNYVSYSSERYCKITAINFGVDTYFFGAPFFYEYYTMFDMSNHQITLAKASYFTSKESSESSGHVAYSAFGIVGAAILCLMAWKNKKVDKNQSDLISLLSKE